MDAQQALVLIVATLVVNVVISKAIAWWLRADEASRRQEAQMVLRAHGLEAYTYLASFGAEAGVLRDALSRFDLYGQVVLDKDGRMVGRVLPKVIQGAKGLRLVVDNTK